MKVLACVASVSLVTLGIACGVWGVQTDLSDTALLEAFDRARFPEAQTASIIVKVTATTTDSTKEAVVRLSFKTIDGGNYARIEFQSPAELAGQVYLSTPDATYFWQPELASPIKVSGRQALFGDSAVAQTSGIRFVEDYTVAAREAIAFPDGTAGLQVSLKAVNSSVAFPTVVVAADAATLRPVSFVLYALSGVPLYEVVILEYAAVGSDTYAKTQLVTNRLSEGNTTRTEIEAIEESDLPDSLFDPAALGKSS